MRSVCTPPMQRLCLLPALLLVLAMCTAGALAQTGLVVNLFSDSACNQGIGNQVYALSGVCTYYALNNSYVLATGNVGGSATSFSLQARIRTGSL